MVQARFTQGFTLIELITVIIVLGVVSVGISGFIRTGVEIYTDVTEREQLIGESRFVVERLNRELRNAVPNSVRVSTNASASIHCIEFVPTEWVSFYTSLSVLPDTSKSATVVEWGDNPAGYVWQAGDFAIVYPNNNNEVYDVNLNKRIAITACTDDGDGDCFSADSASGTIQLTLAGDFNDHSPASRLYIARKTVSYCVNASGQILRNERESIGGAINFYTQGVLMAENLNNDLTKVSEVPFQASAATLTRNGLVHILLAFESNEETINYSNEVHFPNVP